MVSAALAGETLIYGAFDLWLLALIPCAVVTLLKERFLYFGTGWLTFGMAWFVGAFSPAEPGTEWARRLYGEERLARGADPGRHRRSLRTTATMLGGALALLLIVGLLSARPTPVLGVDGKALQYSVGGGNLGLSVEPCEQLGDGSWRCSRYDNQFSGTVAYRVKVNGLGCWQATRIGAPGEGSRRHLDGCLTVWDQIRPFEELF